MNDKIKCPECGSSNVFSSTATDNTASTNLAVLHLCTDCLAVFYPAPSEAEKMRRLGAAELPGLDDDAS